VDAGGATAGTGFLARTAVDRGAVLVLTCAHVVVDAGAGPGDGVDVCFRGAAGWGVTEARAVVDAAAWRDPSGADVAVLQLAVEPPARAAPFVVGSSLRAVRGRRYATFGFSAPKAVEGMPGDVEVVDRTTEDGFPVVTVRSNEVSRGFSGAPVWD